MPAAPIIGAAAGGAGALSSGIGGKKASNNANNLAQQQLQLQQNQFNTSQKQIGAGNAAIAPAQSFWTDLLNGGQAAKEATGPYASLLGQAAQGARTAIQASTPRGGEQNLAVAQNYNDLSNNTARLYAGMQPTAAQNLQNIGAIDLGSGASLNPQANTGAAAGVYGLQQQLAGQSGQGYGGLLYNAVNKLQQGGGGGKNPSGASIANGVAG